MHLFCADGLSQLRNDAVRNCRPLVAEVNDPVNASGVMQLTGARIQFESGKQIVREERLGKPHRPAPGRSLKSYAGQINLNPILHL